MRFSDLIIPTSDLLVELLTKDNVNLIVPGRLYCVFLLDKHRCTPQYAGLYHLWDDRNTMSCSYQPYIKLSNAIASADVYIVSQDRNGYHTYYELGSDELTNITAPRRAIASKQLIYTMIYYAKSLLCDVCGLIGAHLFITEEKVLDGLLNLKPGFTRMCARAIYNEPTRMYPILRKMYARMRAKLVVWMRRFTHADTARLIVQMAYPW